MNWYEDIDFLGFALWTVYPPLDSDFCLFGCRLTICGEQSENIDSLYFYSYREQHCDELNQVWMTYYPQIAIKEMYRSNLWRQFKASFFLCYRNDTRTFAANECGIHLIYAEHHQQKHPLVIHNRDLETWVDNRFTKNVHGTCFQCRDDTEFLYVLCLESTTINEISTIECFSQLETLCLRNCKNLESLPSRIYKLKSLVILSCSGCSKLKSFPEILENMQNLRELHLSKTAIKELPSSIEHLQGLEILDVSYCNKLVMIPESICNLSFLTILDVNFCSKLTKFPKNLGSLQCLEYLRAAGLKSISSKLPSFPGLCSLRTSDPDCSNLVRASDVCCLSSWEASTVSMNAFSSIPAVINQLPKLRVLELSHCHKLRQIPELPSSLRVLDAHSCQCLETLSSPSSLLSYSLLKCFKSAIEVQFSCYLTFFFLCIHKIYTYFCMCRSSNAVPIGERELILLFLEVMGF